MAKVFNTGGIGSGGTKTTPIPFPVLISDLVYNGEEQTVEFDGYDPDKMVQIGEITATDAGTYSAIFSPIGTYVWEDGGTYLYQVSWTIERMPVKVPSQSGTLTYTGSEQTPTWADYDSTQLTLGGTTSGTNAGSYSAEFTPGSNYQWEDGSTDTVSVTWVIGKATPTLTLSPTSLDLTYGNPTGAIAITYNGDGTLSAQSSNADIITAALSGTTVTVTALGIGSAEVTVSAAEGSNYMAASATCAATGSEWPTTTLDENSWDVISAVSAASEGPNYWSVGDTKKIHIEGTVGTLEINEDFYVYILGFDHNADLEGKGITFGGFKTADGSLIDVALCDSNYGSDDATGAMWLNVNHWGNYNGGGWRGCDARYDIIGSTDTPPDGYGGEATAGRMGYDASDTCATDPVTGTLMAAFPEDLRKEMKPMTVYTNGQGRTSTSSESHIVPTVDYLPLLAEFEVQGARTYANTYEQNYQQQYTYYSSGKSKIKYNHTDTGSSAVWRLRSANCYYNSGNYNSNFCTVATDGSASSANAQRSRGLAPAFRI